MYVDVDVDLDLDVCMYIRTYVRMCIHMYLRMYILIYVCKYIVIHTYMHACMHTCMHALAAVLLHGCCIEDKRESKGRKSQESRQSLSQNGDKYLRVLKGLRSVYIHVCKVRTTMSLNRDNTIVVYIYIYIYTSMLSRSHGYGNNKTYIYIYIRIGFQIGALTMITEITKPANLNFCIITYIT